MTNGRLEVTEENAPRFLEWLRARGGVAVWQSVDLSDPGSVSTPARTVEGAAMSRPHWKFAEAPERIITSAADIDVVVWQEVKRSRVGLQHGAQGFRVKLTDAGSRRLRAAVAAAGEDATYKFDYETQDAVVLAPKTCVPLNEWAGLDVTASPL